MSRYMLPYGGCVIALALALSGCNGDNDKDAGQTGARGEDARSAFVEIDTENPFATLLPWPVGDSRIETTESGLQYIVLTSGPPEGRSPETTDLVVVHYEGRLAANGEKFDSSRERQQPAVFPAGALIKGWVEALQLMRPGDRWMLYIPYDLAYGKEGRPPVIPAEADLVFDVDLLEVRDKL